MEREVPMGKLRELEPSNPDIPMVTLKDEPQRNSGNPIAPETLNINTHPSSPDVTATPSFSSSLTPEYSSPHISPPRSAIPATPATPSYEPSPPPIVPPSPASSAYGGGLFSPLLFSEDELSMLENMGES
ncbi:putative ankyrin repeat protein RF_0987 [Triplophysa dalaica]|uniref:putative ankyrin repeat protein RF_0987 n=1 Tax=Triplophysa dalaica TaxID=1582913 RepID=UPI0024DF827C|nr:putative ankyrin repeat protein RF_0987 [Triplophysa dalaica]